MKGKTEESTMKQREAKLRQLVSDKDARKFADPADMFRKKK